MVPPATADLAKPKAWREKLKTWKNARVSDTMRKSPKRHLKSIT